MAQWIEYSDSWEYLIRPEADLHPKSIFEVELCDGVTATFGKPRSKWRSRQYELSNVYFMKDQWELDDIDQRYGATSWVMDRDIRFIDGRKSDNLKVREAELVLELSGNFAGNYVAIFLRGTPKERFFHEYLASAQ